MASFKEIKERINSIKTTRKITSAMKMVSAAKLHKAQRNISSMLPYSNAIQDILKNALSSEAKVKSALMVEREVKKVAIVAFSSDSSLAGAFNSSIIKELHKTTASFSMLEMENIELYTIGKKVYEASVKAGYNIKQNFEELASKPDVEAISGLAESLIRQFETGEIDRVELIYQHFRSAGSQILTRDVYLPIAMPEGETGGKYAAATDYIFEPSREELLETLIPKSLKLRLYTTLLDSNASEHAARMIAMQTATDNADELIGELTIEYNKSRQQAITNELLDMIGGSLN